LTLKVDDFDFEEWTFSCLMYRFGESGRSLEKRSFHEINRSDRTLASLDFSCRSSLQIKTTTTTTTRRLCFDLDD
jgi:hypothetical protein